MSLVKSYRVGCEGIALAVRLGIPMSLDLFREHEAFSPMLEPSAERGRRSAIKAGWTRVNREIALLQHEPNGPTSVIAFDLCPACSAIRQLVG